MKSKIVKCVIFILLILTIISSLNISYAAISNPDNYKVTITGGDRLRDMANKVIGVIQLAGSILSVVVLIVIGIKYMLGSVQEKAEYKKMLMPYIIGAICVFAIVNILGIIESIVP